ncbi:methyltransferase [Candidatus Leptofilum sp.]|uniref:methyltransferase n=1 Tax=Candidatus Leptofilum sp. TaxID=3241576 RepID=UPI003B5C68D6
MPIQPNLLERFAFYKLNAAPTPMLDLAGALGYQALSTAVHLNLFETLQKRPSSLTELAQRLGCQERGLDHLLKALVGIGYVVEKNGRYHNTAMTEKWFTDGTMLDLNNAITCWDAFLRDLWPHAPAVIQSGERPYNFYEYTETQPGLSHAHQQMMFGNANLNGPEIAKRVQLPSGPTRLLDVGGGHGAYTIHLCRAHPNLQATIFDSAIALETARQHVDAVGLNGRIKLQSADIWQVDWGQEYDLILLFNFIHHFDSETNIELLRKAHAALKQGGQVAIFDQLEAKQFGSAISGLLRLISLMYYLFADGRIYSKDEIRQILNKSGFGSPRFFTTPKWAGQSLVTAVKENAS